MLLFFSLLACGDKVEDTGVDTNVEPSTEDTTDTTDTTEISALEIIGNYVDNYDTSHTITETTWSDSWDNSFAITQYDNDANWLIAQNASTNSYNPDLWSTFQWTNNEAGTLFYCQSVFDAATEEDAKANASADGSDLDTGCAGFAWSTLTPE